MIILESIWRVDLDKKIDFKNKIETKTLKMKYSNLDDLNIIKNIIIDLKNKCNLENNCLIQTMPKIDMDNIELIQKKMTESIYKIKYEDLDFSYLFNKCNTFTIYAIANRFDYKKVWNIYLGNRCKFYFKFIIFTNEIKLEYLTSLDNKVQEVLKDNNFDFSNTKKK